MEKFVPVISERNVWTYWHAGLRSMPAWCQRNIVNWFVFLMPNLSCSAFSLLPQLLRVFFFTAVKFQNVTDFENLVGSVCSVLLGLSELSTTFLSHQTMPSTGSTQTIYPRRSSRVQWMVLTLDLTVQISCVVSLFSIMAVLDGC